MARKKKAEDGQGCARNGYDPYRGDWDREVLGNGNRIPDVWEGPMPTIKRPADDSHDFDYDGE